MAKGLDMRMQSAAAKGIKEMIGMKRTLTLLSAALFAGALMVPALHAQEAATPKGAMATAPEGKEASAPKKHHTHHAHHHMSSKKSSKKSAMKGDSMKGDSSMKGDAAPAKGGE
jgi:hypothetical protein